MVALSRTPKYSAGSSTNSQSSHPENDKTKNRFRTISRTNGSTLPLTICALIVISIVGMLGVSRGNSGGTVRGRTEMEDIRKAVDTDLPEYDDYDPDEQESVRRSNPGKDMDEYEYSHDSDSGGDIRKVTDFGFPKDDNNGPDKHEPGGNVPDNYEYSHSSDSEEWRKTEISNDRAVIDEIFDTHKTVVAFASAADLNDPFGRVVYFTETLGDTHYCFEVKIGISIQQYAEFSRCDTPGVVTESNESYKLGTYNSAESTSSRQVYSDGTHCAAIKKDRRVTLMFIEDHEAAPGSFEVSISEPNTCVYIIELRLALVIGNSPFADTLARVIKNSTPMKVATESSTIVEGLAQVIITSTTVAILEVAANKTCGKRDVSKYNGERYRRLPSQLTTGKCHTFNCTKYSDRVAGTCNGTLPTNYDGTDPPCCNHIVRDMAIIFDNTMCSLGLDNMAAWGTLLGLVRSDQLIPWTFDNDYIISSNTASAMVDLWDNRTTGMSYIWQGIPRMCATTDFAEGKLQKWRMSPLTTQLWNSGSPYIDLYVGITNITKAGKFSATPGCVHDAKDIWPTKRLPIYGGKFYHNFPANHTQVIKTMYGPKWRTPDSKRRPHGSGDVFW